MASSTLRRDFDRDGYVAVRGFLGAAELGQLCSELDRYIRDVVPTLSERDAFFLERGRPETLKQLQHMGRDPYFREYATHPRWLGLAEELLGEEVRGQEPEWFNKPRGTSSPTPPHQDNFYFCLRPPQVVTVWLALDPVDDENGCLRYVCGSHRRGVRPHGPSQVLGFSQAILDFGPPDLACEAAVHLAPGDAVVHHGETIHRADANASRFRDRRAFAMVIQGRSCRRDDEAFSRYEAALRHQHHELGIDR
jgi:phytanoyl-CoA hydroxylase